MHISIVTQDGDNVLSVPRFLKHLVAKWVDCEPVFYTLAAPWRRCNRYCESVYECVGCQDWRLGTVSDATLLRLDKQFVLNLKNTKQIIRTIEVRLKHGSTDAREVHNWAAFLCMFVRACLASTSTCTDYFDYADTRGPLPRLRPQR